MKEEIAIQPMSPIKLKDMPIPHKIGPEPVPMTGYERAYSLGFRDGFAAADFSSVCIFLCGISILALIAACMLVMNRASQRNRMRENCSGTEIPGKQMRNLASLIIPVFLCFCLLACSGKKTAFEIQVSETEVAAEELAPVAPDVANAPENADKQAKTDAFSPHDAVIGEDKQTLAVHIPEDVGGAPRRDEPTELAELLQMKGKPAKEKTAVKMLRPNAIREAAQLMGFQSGMAWRYGQLLAETENYSPVMDAAFNFSPLLLTQGEALILPPQISSGGVSMRIEDADTATSSKTTYELLEPAKFISTVPMWREFLMADDFPKAEEPNPAILPRDSNERAFWRKAIREAWNQGIAEADQLYADNVFRMARSYKGILLYHLLTAQHLLSRVHTASANLGIRTHGNKLNIGQNVYRITAPARFIPHKAKGKK